MTHRYPASVDRRCSTARPRRTIRKTANRIVLSMITAVGEPRTPVVRFRGGELARVTVHCLELIFDALDGRPYPARIPLLEEAVENWARQGVPLETIHHAVHAGARCFIDLAVAHRVGQDSVARPSTRVERLSGGAGLVIDALDAITTTIAVAYARELRAMAVARQSAIHTVTAALLSGRVTTVMAHESGIEIADRYAVLALHTSPDGGPAADRGCVQRLRSELVNRCGPATLALLSPRGGTVLVPRAEIEDAELDELVAALAKAADTALTATVVAADRHAVPAAANEVHRLLDTVIHLGYPCGLYRFADIALQAQFARPGPARDRLAAVLAPLEDNPELIRLLRAHYHNGLDRRRTARQFGVHTNTIDNRLKNIARLTGCDPASGDGAWILQSALAARGFA